MMPTVVEISKVFAHAGAHGTGVKSAHEPMLFQKSLKAVGIELLVGALDQPTPAQVETNAKFGATAKPSALAVMVSALSQRLSEEDKADAPDRTLAINQPSYPAETFAQGMVDGRLVATLPNGMSSQLTATVDQGHEIDLSPQRNGASDGATAVAIHAQRNSPSDTTLVKHADVVRFVGDIKKEGATGNNFSEEMNFGQLHMQATAGNMHVAVPAGKPSPGTSDKREVDPSTSLPLNDASVRSLKGESGPQSSVTAVIEVKGNRNPEFAKSALRGVSEKPTTENKSNGTPQVSEALTGVTAAGLPVAVAPALANDNSDKNKQAATEEKLDPLGPKSKRKQMVGPAQSGVGAAAGVQGLHNVALSTKDVSPETKTPEGHISGQGTGMPATPGKAAPEPAVFGIAEAVHGRLDAPIREAAATSSQAERSPAGAVSHHTVPEQMMATTNLSAEGDGRPRQVGLLVATSSSLEVGIANGTHGWLRIRAQLEDGVVTALLSPATSKGSEMLHRELPSLTAFMREEQVGGGVVLIKEAPAVDANGSTLDADKRGGGEPAQHRSQERESQSPGSLVPKNEIWNHSDREVMSHVLSGFGGETGYLQDVAQGSWLNVRV